MSATFDDYANDVIVPCIESYAQRHSRIDVVFDVYYDDSLKGGTRKKRGTGARQKVTGNTRPPKSWNTFLRCDQNNTYFFRFLSDKIITANTDSVIIVTKDDIVISNSDIDTEHLAPCNNEEADTRMFFSRQTCSSKGNTNITISSSDTVTDVAVLAISVFIDLHINELWIAFGKEKDFR